MRPLHLAIIWHQHQPLFRDLAAEPRGSYHLPWVRLHAIRDYVSMAAMVEAHPSIHVTFNLTPVLLWQIVDYVENGASDRSMELSQVPAEELTSAQRAELLRTFFDANPANQIRMHARYAELYDRARQGAELTTADLRDLQAWFNLAWFGLEFRRGEVALATGDTVTVRHLVERGRDFTPEHVREIIDAQMRIMRAVIPIHRRLQEQGQVEIATSPFHHTILPLLVDTDAATIDRRGAAHPPRFTRPEDAEAQLAAATARYRDWFGREPRGLWPPEGAVSDGIVPLVARRGFRWMASDGAVLQRSGEHGHDIGDPGILCRPYRVEHDGAAITFLFRDATLSDLIGFQYQQWPDPGAAARDFVRRVLERVAPARERGEDLLLTVLLDGENAWGAYADDGRPFLHALYRTLADSTEIITVTPSEYLAGNAARRVAPHPVDEQRRLDRLFPGSWADEIGSAAGVDHGTWIGEDEENRAWMLLGRVRADLAASGTTAESAPLAWNSLYAAEGSDWMWWLGEDYDSGRDPELHALFRTHLANVYRGLGREVPEWLEP